MVSDSYHIDDYGVCNGTVYGGTCNMTNGSATINVGATVWAAVSVGDMLFCQNMDDTDAWFALRIVTKIDDTTDDKVTVHLTSFPTKTGVPFYYSLYPRTLGDVTHVQMTTSSTLDTFGIPYDEWLAPLVYDSEGAVKRIIVSGFYVDTIGSNLTYNKGNVIGMFDGNQGVGNPAHMFWHYKYTSYSIPRAFPVCLENYIVEEDANFKTTGTTNEKQNYTLQMIVRAM